MKVQDVVCGMTIEAESAAATVPYEGKTYYFCSEHCRRTFEEDPGRYASAAGSGDESGGHGHAHDH